MSLISRQQTQSSVKSLISESMSVEISFMYRDSNNGQERTLVGHLTKLEPTPKFQRLQQLIVFYNKERIYPPEYLSANAITK